MYCCHLSLIQWREMEYDQHESQRPKKEDTILSKGTGLWRGTRQDDGGIRRGVDLDPTIRFLAFIHCVVSLMAPIIVDNDVKLRALLALIADCLRQQPNQLLFIDLEGVNLSREGIIAILQLLLPPSPIVYLVDVHVLGAKAFETTPEDGTGLKSVLESEAISKVFFDIRNDSDALYAHFSVDVAGIIDLQLMEYATRQPRGKFVNGLARCIENDLPYSSDWSRIKADGRRSFAPEAGGRYEVFLERPLAENIAKYCEQDVLFMPRLLAIYGRNILPGVAAQLQGIVKDRILLSKTPGYNGVGRHMAVGPHLAPAR
jgi:exonuclease 3'-5' domain-containing protein 1